MTSKINHGKPNSEMTCLCTWDYITNNEYVEYQTVPSGKWHASLFGYETIQMLLNTQFNNYIENIQKTDCKKELKRLLDLGPPIWISDIHGLPIPKGDTNISKLWYMKNNLETTARLNNSLIGD